MKALHGDLCVDCMTNPAMPNRNRCEYCTKETREQQRAARGSVGPHESRDDVVDVAYRFPNRSPGTMRMLERRKAEARLRRKAIAKGAGR